ncbi:MAG: 23S rRNA (pseudouridine(1915)-N(3))-methyltransferase RlmH [Microbacter sp.]
MRCTLLLVGKTSESYLNQGIQKYVDRIKHYISFEVVVVPDLKNVKSLTREQQKKQEGELLLKTLDENDLVILLDENGETMSSESFADWLQKKMMFLHKRIVFVVGGPYGFSDAVYQRAAFQLSFSKMTFSHQMIRLFFVEQLYRAMTIIKREPYHHA